METSYLAVLYAGKIVASFYTVQYEHTNELLWVVHISMFQIPRRYVSAKNWQNRMKSGKDITKIKRVMFSLITFFSETHCIRTIHLYILYINYTFYV